MWIQRFFRSKFRFGLISPLTYIFLALVQHSFSRPFLRATIMSATLRLAAVLSLFSSNALAHNLPNHWQHRRAIVPAAADINDNYDFVIAGGGVGGLAMAARLSEDANATVLVLEAGESGDDVASQIGACSVPRSSGSSILKRARSRTWQHLLEFPRRFLLRLRLQDCRPSQCQQPPALMATRKGARWLVCDQRPILRPPFQG